MDINRTQTDINGSDDKGSTTLRRTHVNVVVQFYPWFKFYFPLFCSMLMYDDKFETKENKILNQGKKLNHNIYLKGLCHGSPVHFV